MSIAPRRFLVAATLAALACGFSWSAAAAAADDQARGSDAVEQVSDTPVSPDAPTTPDAPSQTWALHFQSTATEQFHPAFPSPYSGAQSLNPGARGAETVDATVFFGVSLWKGMELWADPEVDQGYGLSDTLGIAGFPSGEAYKVGASTPYLRLQRLFLRQTIDLGGAREAVDADENQLAGTHTADRIVITVGKFSVPDIFDGNSYAHDPRSDFLNWSLLDTGTFDYAADSWGYTPGLAVEWYTGAWVFRTAVMDMSTVPNSPNYDPTFGQFQLIEEVERDWSVKGRQGKIRVTGFLTRARMATFADAIAYGVETGWPPELAPVRHYTSRPGLSISAEQQLTDNVGVFLRAGWADGTKEPYEFTDIDRTVAAGVSINGAGWGRAGDTVGVGGAINGISTIHEQYLADGGMGILVGDGQLPRPSTEKDLETYYKLPLAKHLDLTVDYQLSVDPGYNTQRGPVSIFGARLHIQY
jgi:high affinity Mn2+ porin